MCALSNGPRNNPSPFGVLGLQTKQDSHNPINNIPAHPHLHNVLCLLLPSLILQVKERHVHKLRKKGSTSYHGRCAFGISILVLFVCCHYYCGGVLH